MSRKRGAEAAARRGRRRLPGPAPGDRSGPLPRQRHAGRSPRASTRSTASSKRRPIGSPIGASRRATSTTAASSTSTASRACASRTRRCSSDSHATDPQLVREGRVQGLRIDHIDGLADPEGYLRALRSAVGPGFYIVVEKILEPGEALRALAGGGHDRLRHPQPHRRPVRRRRARPMPSSASTLRLRARRALRRPPPAREGQILVTSFASELEMLVSDLKRMPTPTAGRATTPPSRSAAASSRSSPASLSTAAISARASRAGGSRPDRGRHRGGEARSSACRTARCMSFVGAALLGDVGPAGPAPSVCAASAGASSSSPAR